MEVHPKITERIKSFGEGEFERILKEVFSSEFTIKDIGISHRWITHWEKEGLLINPKTEKNEKWRRFNTFEFVWLRLIVEMRKFNISLDVIRKLKKITDPLDEVMKAYQTIARILAETASDSGASIPKEYYELSVFEKMVLDISIFKTNYVILVNLKGEYCPFIEEYLVETLKNPLLLQAFRENHISISFSGIINDLFKASSEESLLTTYSMISKKEKKVLELLKQDDLVHAEIVYDKDHKIDLLRLKTHEKIDIHSRVKDNIIKKGYQSITVKTADSHVVHCEKVITHKLNNQ